MNDDSELLHRYVVEGAEDAFAELVRRHLNLVYSAALRQVNGDAPLAADIAQLVFTDLARKAALLANHRVLAGWLFTNTRFAAAKAVRGERRRHARERKAQMRHEPSTDPAAPLDWSCVRPVLDEIIDELSDRDREAILLRFFEGRDCAGVGARLNLNDDTARMRVERALDTLRALLERRGVTSTTAALAAAMANQAVLAAPAGLAATVTGAALAGAGAGAGVATTAATFVGVTKSQIGLAAALAVVGATGFVIQENTNATLRGELAALGRQEMKLAALRVEDEQRAKTAAEIAELRSDDAEFARLRDETEALKGRLEAGAQGRLAGGAVPAADPSRGPTYDIGQLDRPPRPSSQPRPAYPAELRKAGLSGEVQVEFIVDAQGAVREARAVNSTWREFESAAIEAVSKWKFLPGQKDGRPVGARLRMPIVFRLSDGAGTPAADQGKKPGQPNWF
ncbi:MAG: TonB family protein [Verrucomicrobia bacterium]|nr:TonB family protein [Verrucomicrobiota bacterium]